MSARFGRAIRGYALIHAILTVPDAQPDDRDLVETTGGCNRGAPMGKSYIAKLVPVSELVGAMHRLADQTGHNVQPCPICLTAVEHAQAEQREAAR